MPLSPAEKKDRARWARIKKVYGIDEGIYKSIATDICPICTRAYTQSNPACVDHDHVTGEVRGVVCRYCNHRIIGRHRDYILLGRLVTYLTPPFTGYIVPPKPKRKRKKKVKK